MPLVTRQAEQGNIFKQGTEPPNWQEGDLWADTTDDTLYINKGGTASLVGNTIARVIALG